MKGRFFLLAKKYISFNEEEINHLTIGEAREIIFYALH